MLDDLPIVAMRLRPRSEFKPYDDPVITHGRYSELVTVVLSAASQLARRHRKPLLSRSGLPTAAEKTVARA